MFMGYNILEIKKGGQFAYKSFNKKMHDETSTGVDLLVRKLTLGGSVGPGPENFGIDSASGLLESKTKNALRKKAEQIRTEPGGKERLKKHLLVVGLLGFTCIFLDCAEESLTLEELDKTSAKQYES